MTIPALPPALLRRSCDADLLPFATTAELNDDLGPVGQDRAVKAVRFAIGIRSPGFNLFALGPDGTGKKTLIHRALTEAAAARPVADDWAYVHNFAEPHRPRALRLPPGRGPALRDDMDRLVDDLRLALPTAFEGDEYRTRRQVLEEQFRERRDDAFNELRRHAAAKSIALVRTPVGFALAPMDNDEVLSPDQFSALPQADQDRFQADLQELQHQLENLIRAIPQGERELRDKVRQLDREVAGYAVEHLVEDVMRRWRDVPGLAAYLTAVQADVIDNVAEFLAPSGAEDEAERLPAMLRRMRPLPDFRRYRVNVLVTSAGGDGGAPVVHEDHPTQPNLVGRIEHTAQFGALLTDFSLIKAGALHRANGGFLILDARKLLMQPFAYEDLKRALRTCQIRIEMPGQSLGLWSTTSLEPEPIPLDVKVVLLGDPMLYYLLSHHDHEFPELFKVAADFDYRMDRSPEAVMGLARVVASLVRRDGLKPLDRGAVARVIEHAARKAEDSEKLSTHVAGLVDLVREADWIAGEEGAAVVCAAHVQEAINAHIFRSDRVRDHILEEIRRGTVLIDTEGAVVGQINGLAVFELGNFAFGRPSRITCRLHMGKGEVVDIEREVDLGGPIHSKGVLILASFLMNRFGMDQPLSLSASLVFEQSYGGIEGDSASSTELYALLSALAEAPLRQDLAVTGSVNQLGQVQAIGGVNEKIEGFFDVCRARGLTGRQGVLIPAANVKHLMLRPDVVEAAQAGQFHIYPVETIDQGIEILTGMPAGTRDARGEWPTGSINRRVAARLASFARRTRDLALAEHGGSERNGR